MSIEEHNRVYRAPALLIHLLRPVDDSYGRAYFDPTTEAWLPGDDAIRAHKRLSSCMLADLPFVEREVGTSSIYGPTWRFTAGNLDLDPEETHFYCQIQRFADEGGFRHQISPCTYDGDPIDPWHVSRLWCRSRESLIDAFALLGRGPRG